jgi:hypothetical protein
LLAVSGDLLVNCAQSVVLFFVNCLQSVANVGDLLAVGCSCLMIPFAVSGDAVVICWQPAVSFCDLLAVGRDFL